MSDETDKKRDESERDDSLADRSGRYAEESWTGEVMTGRHLSLKRLKGAFAHGPAAKPRHDSSWRTHKIEEDDPGDDSAE